MTENKPSWWGALVIRVSQTTTGPWYGVYQATEDHYVCEEKFDWTVAELDKANVEVIVDASNQVEVDIEVLNSYDRDDAEEIISLAIPGDVVRVTYETGVTISSKLEEDEFGGLSLAELPQGFQVRNVRGELIAGIEKIKFLTLASRNPDWWGSNVVEREGRFYLYNSHHDSYMDESGFHHNLDRATVVVDKEGNVVS